MAWLDSLNDIFQKIPAALWVVFGSLISLSGVVLTNRASEQRLKSQFLHDRDLRNSDRELALRKEVYLSVAEALHAGFIAIGKMPNLEMTLDEITRGYFDRAPALAKVQIISREETVKAVVCVAEELTASMLRMTVKRMPLEMQRRNLAVLDTQIFNFEKARDRWIELMTQHNIDRTVDQHRWNMLDGNYKFEQQRISDTLSKKSIAVNHFFIQTLEFSKEYISESYSIVKTVIPAIKSMRNDLGIETDEAVFSKIFQESIRRQSATVAGVFEAIEKFKVANATEDT
jgi:hypothetical protein